ncbi:MAG: DUF2378 family protein [Myxococcota bacterium]
MGTQRLWFTQAIEGLFIRGLGERLTPAVRAKILEAGIDLSRLEPAYPIEQVFRGARSVLPLLWPGVPEDEAFRQLGVAFMRGYAQTLVGGAMVQMMKLIGTRRTLERMQKNFRTGGNYLETRFTPLGPTSVELWINDVSGMPGLYTGIIEEGGHFVGTKNLRIVAQPDAPPAHLYRIDWDA